MPLFCWYMLEKSLSSMDLGLFYSACNAAHRELFSTLVYEWTQVGLPWRWTDDGNIALCARTADRETNPALFVLDRGGLGRQEAICVGLEVWNECLGHADAARFVTVLRGIDGLESIELNNKVILPTPGHVFGPVQHQLRKHIQSLAYRLRDLIGL